MYEKALSPLKIGGLTVPNRIVRPAHTANNTPGGIIGERFLATHEEAARGGVGLTITGAAAIHPSSLLHPNGLAAWSDDCLLGLTQFAERMAPYPMRTIVQLWHGGHNAFTADGSPPWSASATPGPLIGVTAMAMSRAQIAEITEAYRLAAQRVVRAGLHGCEIHAGHGYLLRQFLARALNQREDAYGGDLDGRARFLMEVLRAVRGAVPKDFVVGIRMGPDTRPGLTEFDEMMQVVRRIEDEGLVDYLNLTLGEYSAPENMAAPMHEPAGYQLPTNAPAKANSALPLLVTGRFRTLDEAEDALQTGQADLVGMVRAHIADPHLVRKSVAGHPESVRPCIACNQLCIGGLFGPTGEPSCVVNPTANQEYRHAEDLKPVATPKSVLVIGGGVAGMEAARVAAERGHRVQLFEAADALGGTVKHAARAPRQGPLGDIADWQARELDRLGVHVVLGTPADLHAVRAAAPDVVVIATGARPRKDAAQRGRPGQAVKGLERTRVFSTLELLQQPRESLGRSAVVLDDVGHYEGIAASEHLVNAGLTVHYVTRHAAFAPLMDATFRAQPAYARLNRSGRFHVHARAVLSAVDAEGATLYDAEIDAAPRRLPADLVVTIGYNQPNLALAAELEAEGIPVHRIGDALSPRFMEAAIHEGYRLGCSL